MKEAVQALGVGWDLAFLWTFPDVKYNAAPVKGLDR